MNHAAQLAIVKQLSRQESHSSVGPGQVTHSGTVHVADHALITWLLFTDHVTDHALIMWLIMH